MNIWQHALLSERKFGGKATDYTHIHRFIDSSKYFYYHVKHRMLLHNLYGVELCTQLFGEFVVNADGKTILVRDIAVEHCREDLNGKVPTLYEWLRDNQDLADWVGSVPELEQEEWNHFVWKPFLRTGLRAAFVVTCSDLGVQLMEQFYGLEAARALTKALHPKQKIGTYLPHFKFAEKWQYTPQPEELQWLKNYEQNKNKTNHSTTDLGG